MQQLIQSAIEAAKHNDKNKAIELIKQVLSVNPNDVDAWLVLAAVMDDTKHKRECLNRVLRLDPVNKVAREELIEMDREAMRGSLPFVPKPAPASTPGPQPVPQPLSYLSNTAEFEPASTPQAKPQAAAQPKPASKPRGEKAMVFKFPLFWRILMYLSLIVFGCIGLLIATQNVINSLPFLGLAALVGLTAIAFSPKVEISESGIRASGMFKSSEARWGEIVKMKSNAMKRRLELSTNNGEILNVSTQVSGYPRIVEILRKRRPDLFGVASNPSLQNKTTATPSFTGTKIFRKGFFAQYGVFLLTLPFCMIGVWLLLVNEDKFVGIGIGAVGLFFMAMSLFNNNQIKLEPNKLTTESFLKTKEFTARQIKGISMKTVRSRHGIATNFVSVQPMEGSAISLAGFPEGDEIIYGILNEWWETYKNR